MRIPQLLLFTILAIPALAAGKPEDEIMHRDREFNQAVAARRLEGWMEFMAPNAVIGIAQGDAVSGTDAIRTSMEKPFGNPDFTLTWEPTHGEVFRGGTMGYTVGRWTRTIKREGKNQVATGTYITIWQKQPDGRWMVAGDGGTPDSEPQKR